MHDCFGIPGKRLSLSLSLSLLSLSLSPSLSPSLSFPLSLLLLEKMTLLWRGIRATWCGQPPSWIMLFVPWEDLWGFEKGEVRGWWACCRNFRGDRYYCSFASHLGEVEGRWTWLSSMNWTKKQWSSKLTKLFGLQLERKEVNNLRDSRSHSATV